MNQTVLQRNNVNIPGKGKQYMIFAPDFGCSQTMWRMIASALEQDYRVVLFDYRSVNLNDLNA
ncbi:alpha/beta fold hydrolase [Paenibacillus wynnii]|uniref:alpha/beta fold hydrolase n=1 Tax=Paenibacillus wynnii TaxID=268407 RepID=UPI00278CEB73|nr:hypothetical protein [Paenibacillus wynnii]MDQ0196536.1 putative alpha/beta hydrolase [Paenibacillus wynnii]